MPHALVIHPKLSILAGGEFICLNVIEACLENGWKVTLVSDAVDLAKVDEIYARADILRKIDWIELPVFKPFMSRFRALQAIRYGRRFKQFIQKIFDNRQIFDSRPIDMIFSTQSSLFGVKGVPSYHFCYSYPKDLFVYPFAYYQKRNRWLYDTAIKLLVRLFIGKKPVPTAVFCNSKAICDMVEREGYEAHLYYPPIQPYFRPKPKKKQVILASRFDKWKRLEWFVEIAKLCPEYPFILVCRRDGSFEKMFNPGYADMILDSLPSNVKFIPTPIRQVPWLLEESKIFLYTGTEPGIALVTNEGVSAGCFPMAPKGTGNAEVIDSLGIGYTYTSPREAADLIRKEIEGPDRSQEIAMLATRFYPEMFQKLISGILLEKK